MTVQGLRSIWRVKAKLKWNQYLVLLSYHYVYPLLLLNSNCKLFCYGLQRRETMSCHRKRNLFDIKYEPVIRPIRSLLTLFLWRGDQRLRIMWLPAWARDWHGLSLCRPFLYTRRSNKHRHVLLTATVIARVHIFFRIWHLSQQTVYTSVDFPLLWCVALLHVSRVPSHMGGRQIFFFFSQSRFCVSSWDGTVNWDYALSLSLL